jgi:hypothetical protein
MIDFWSFEENTSNWGSYLEDGWETWPIPYDAADSRITCALAPPIPNELTEARSYFPLGQTVPSEISCQYLSMCTWAKRYKRLGYVLSVGTIKLALSKGIFGFGRLKKILGGIIFFSRARIAFIRLDRPLAPSP